MMVSPRSGALSSQVNPASGDYFRGENTHVHTHKHTHHFRFAVKVQLNYHSITKKSRDYSREGTDQEFRRPLKAHRHIESVPHVKFLKQRVFGVLITDSRSRGR